ncbi:unnamed protein product, partial [Didymodactylos carnosus]
MDVDLFDDIPCDLLSITNETFFQLTQQLAGDIEADILKVQGINNIHSLLRAKDLFLIFQLDCDELNNLKTRACLKLKTGEYIIRPGIKQNLDYCISLFKNKIQEQHQQQLTGELLISTVTSIPMNDAAHSFLSTFIDNINKNTRRSKNNYQYDLHVRRFASCVFTLGGRNAYEFLRINLPGAFPSISALESYDNEFYSKIEECDFRFDALNRYLQSINCKFAYSSEDCTGVVSKINYDVNTNSFTGFCPILHNGIPAPRQYQTDNFFQLKEWFSTIAKSTLVNVHMIEPLATLGTKSSSFLLSAFGTNNKITSISIIRRWIYIYDQCCNSNIRIIGYSTDCDPKYLRAVRLASGYFAQLPNINLVNKAGVFKLNVPSSWFYLRPIQLFLFFQDPIHLATKLRNRLLSKKAQLMMGTQHITLQHLQDLVENRSKLDHNLVSSDLFPK